MMARVSLRRAGASLSDRPSNEALAGVVDSDGQPHGTAYCLSEGWTLAKMSLYATILACQVSRLSSKIGHRDGMAGLRIELVGWGYKWTPR